LKLAGNWGIVAIAERVTRRAVELFWPRADHVAGRAEVRLKESTMGAEQPKLVIDVPALAVISSIRKKTVQLGYFLETH
jgi:hypothetical protein